MSISATYTNREFPLAVFLFIVILLIGALPIPTGCGNRQQDTQTGTSVADETDLYTLEVLKDRKETDLYLLQSPGSPIKASEKDLFAGLKYYPPDKSFAFLTMLRRLDKPEEVIIATSKDRPRTMYYIGDFPFSYEGSDYRLRVFQPKDTSDGNYWFIPFTDANAGGETYGAGRYIDIENTSSDSTFLDFNYAYNPYCAYNDRYDCPVPPKENRLPIKIRAGEKSYHQDTSH